MTRNRSRHVPVVDGGRLCGLLSVGDLVKVPPRRDGARVADPARGLPGPRPQGAARAERMRAERSRRYTARPPPSAVTRRLRPATSTPRCRPGGRAPVHRGPPRRPRRARGRRRRPQRPRPPRVTVPARLRRTGRRQAPAQDRGVPSATTAWCGRRADHRAVRRPGRGCRSRDRRRRRYRLQRARRWWRDPAQRTPRRDGSPVRHRPRSRPTTPTARRARSPGRSTPRRSPPVAPTSSGTDRVRCAATGADTFWPTSWPTSCSRTACRARCGG